MNTQEINKKTGIIVSRGIFDLLKDHVNRKKLSKYNEEKLLTELKNAQQVLSKDIPEDVVTVNRTITLLNTGTQEKTIHNIVPPGVAKRKNGTLSILSPIGVALVGYKVGAEVTWEMPHGVETFVIEQVSKI